MIKDYIYLVLAGLVGGLIGGMGMGGGTLLIPLLSLVLKVPQHIAQWLNLIAFVPMAVIALIIHCKNKLVEFSKILPVLIPAVFTSVLSSFIAVKAAPVLLRRLFGGFLIVMAVYSLIMTYCEYRKSRKHDNIGNR